MLPTLGQWLAAAPLARRSPEYYGAFLTSGEFMPNRDAAVELSKLLPDDATVLELSAGKTAQWSRAVRQKCCKINLLAADLEPPDAGNGIQSLALDNTRILDDTIPCNEFALIYGSHALCTCRWPGALLAFAARAGDPAAVTCGGLPIERRAVHNFVKSLGAKLDRRNGVAIFDQEGGWPWGLEALLREAAEAEGLYFYVRKGPLLTNFDYVFCTVPLEDDVSPDFLQRSARATDVMLLLFAPAVVTIVNAANQGGVDPGLFPLINSAKACLALGLALRLTLPFLDVLTMRDLVERLSSRP